MKVAITGATGLVGTSLVQALRRDGHYVCRLLRRRVVDETETKQGCDLEWDPAPVSSHALRKTPTPL